MFSDSKEPAQHISPGPMAEIKKKLAERLRFSHNNEMSDHTPATLLGAILAGLRRWPSFLWWLEAQYKGVRFEGKVLFVGRPLISVAKGSRFQIGNNVNINSSLRSNPLGCFQPSVLRTLCPDAELVLDANVGISGCVLCAAKSIHIGEGVNIGSGALLMDTDFHQPIGQWEWGSDPGRGARPIHIGRGAFIGARAIVLKGVTIGERAVVGAGAVVTKPVPPRHFAVGNPARIIPIPDGYFAGGFGRETGHGQ